MGVEGSIRGKHIRVGVCIYTAHVIKKEILYQEINIKSSPYHTEQRHTKEIELNPENCTPVKSEYTIKKFKPKKEIIYPNRKLAIKTYRKIRSTPRTQGNNSTIWKTP